MNKFEDLLVEEIILLTFMFEATSTSPEKTWTFVAAIYKYPTIFLVV